MKNDKYKKARGGWSRMLDIECESCGTHICFYQKDGPGALKRMYVDRMSDIQLTAESLRCSHCNAVLGTKMIYKKEDRPAYRLYVGSVTKKIVKASSK
jgi:hypothetical protein